jgi:hypothetical protein
LIFEIIFLFYSRPIKTGRRAKKQLVSKAQSIKARYHSTKTGASKKEITWCAFTGMIMIDAFVTYLKTKSAPASSLELARQVLKMNITDDSLACRIIQPILHDVPDIVLTAEQQWMCVASPPVEEMGPMDFALCKIVPEKVYSFHQWWQAGCAVVSEEQVMEKRFFPLHGNRLTKGLGSLLRFVRTQPLLFDGFGNQISIFHRALHDTGAMPLEQPVFSLRRFVKQIFPQQEVHDPSRMAEMLGVRFYESDQLDIQLDWLVEAYLALRHMLYTRGMRTWAEWRSFYDGEVSEIDFSSYAFDRLFIDSLPASPGVYIMRDRDDQVIYVGKAKSLVSRLGSYFKNSGEPDEKIQTIRDRLFKIEIHNTGSELDALLLEQKYIQDYRPPINRQVHVRERPQKQKSRYQRILFMPSDQPGQVRLYVLSSEKGVQTIDAAVDLSDFAAVKALVRKACFGKTKPGLSGLDENMEIIASWLSMHEEHISSLDLRKVTSPDEAFRLLADHIRSFAASQEKVIHY